MVEEWDIREDGITITGVKKKNSYRTAKCPKCGRFMEMVLTSGGGIMLLVWYCVNPKCHDGKKNV